MKYFLLILSLIVFENYFIYSQVSITNSNQINKETMVNKDTNISKTTLKAVEAYGGKELWSQYKYIEAEVSASALAFILKWRPYFNHATIKMEISKPYSKITPIGKDPKISGILDGNDVRLVNSNGVTLKEAKNIRTKFPGFRRFFWWDDLDMAYFANYAFWNYFTLPHLLLDTNIIWLEKKEGVLEATFPETYPTHSKNQLFIFDTISGLLLQHNYTVDVFGKWAKVANIVTENNIDDMVPYSSARLVSPIKKTYIRQYKNENISLYMLIYQSAT